MLHRCLLGTVRVSIATAKGGKMPWFAFEGGTDDAQGGNSAGTYQQVDQQIALFGELPGGADFGRLGAGATRPRSGLP
jgi:hypothetical protein